MDKSLKIGAVSGLIAGIVSAIVYQFFVDIAFSLGFYDPWWRENVYYTSHLAVYILVLDF
ncbi:MAG: hypothetical protein NWF08_03405 [Candidatus Bathyarchaeota archaeon]|nr:hypothetical protein [Candidatus Bathyarchaeota archaeon]